MSIRSFIAIKVPDLIGCKIATLQEDLQSAATGVRWVQPHHFHLTLKFLGNIEPGEVARIGNQLQEVGSSIRPFSLNFASAGGFPPSGKLRVIWVGIGRGKFEVQELFKQLNNRLVALDIKGDTKPFRPHLTIGRIKKESSTRALRLLMEKHKGFSTPDFSVSSIYLFKSELTPKGPIYTTLYETRLSS